MYIDAVIHVELPQHELIPKAGGHTVSDVCLGGSPVQFTPLLRTLHFVLPFTVLHIKLHP